MKWQSKEVYKVVLFYRYVKIENTNDLIVDFREKCSHLHLMGRILVSSEGINGTLAGSVACIDKFEELIRKDDRFSTIDLKYSLGGQNGSALELPFKDLSIRFVDEIISCGQDARAFIDSNISFDKNTFGGITGTGVHLSPEEFHDGVQQPNSIVLDIRNKFEYDIGHFENAIGLDTNQYSETFDSLDNILSCERIPIGTNTNKECVELPNKDQSIYMYCTGGIRCEKASAYLKAKGFNNIFQLQGGIHKYLEAFPTGGNFQGKNFVFDGRIAMAPEQQPVNNSEVGNGVVGRCIDCEAPHDAYSGSITCTVCRMPLLVCSDCVTNRQHINEYHCGRHRDLKDLYFTVLEKYSIQELLTQKEGLQRLVDHSLASNSNQIRALISEGNSDEVEVLNSGKNRRRTLRRQIDKIDTRLKQLYAQNPTNEQGNSVGSNPMARNGKGMWCD